jgi:hypothetical protein
MVSRTLKGYRKDIKSTNFSSMPASYPMVLST